MSTRISQIVAANNLQPGDVMKSISGAEIEGSLVVSRYCALIRRDDPVDGGHPGYDLYTENAITGAETTVRLSQDALDIIRNSTI